MIRNLFISSLIIFVVAVSCDELDISDNQSKSFIKYYNDAIIFTAADVKQVNGSGYAILGTIISSDKSQICLLRTDAFGNTIDSARHYTRSLNDQAFSLKVMDDGGFAILGSSLNDNTQKKEVYFIRTNSVGDTLWTRTIAASSGDIEARHFEVDDQGSFIMTGYAVETVKKICIAALDKDGNQPYWSPRIHPSNKDAEGRHIQLLADGSLVITGTSRNDLLAPAYSHAFILKATASGIPLEIYYLPTNADEDGKCIRAMDNNHYLILGTLKRGAESEISLHYVSLTDREVVWEQTYGGTGIDIGNCVLTEGNSIYILGTTATSGINSAISLITTDIFGNQTARTDFGQESQFSGCSIERTADGGFVISGTNEHSDNSISVAIIKTGSDTSL